MGFLLIYVPNPDNARDNRPKKIKNCNSYNFEIFYFLDFFLIFYFLFFRFFLISF